MRAAFLHYNPVAYLDYDGSLTTEPVNQVPYLQTYQRNAAVSAHDLQVTLGTDVMQSATDDDYQTVKHSFIHLIGAAWQRYVEWAPVDPEELIIGGNYDGTPLWSAIPGTTTRPPMRPCAGPATSPTLPGGSTSMPTCPCSAGCAGAG